jgi:hypothetical protein
LHEVPRRCVHRGGSGVVSFRAHYSVRVVCACRSKRRTRARTARTCKGDALGVGHPCGGAASRVLGVGHEVGERVGLEDHCGRDAEGLVLCQKLRKGTLPRPRGSDEVATRPATEVYIMSHVRYTCQARGGKQVPAQGRRGAHAAYIWCAGGEESIAYTYDKLLPILPHPLLAASVLC